MFNLVEIDKNEFRELFSEIEPSHTKWLASYFHLKESVCFRINKSESNLCIGIGYSADLDQKKDYSLLIFPEFQRRGFGSALIQQLIQEDENCRFTVNRNNLAMRKLMIKLSKADIDKIVSV